MGSTEASIVSIEVGLGNFLQIRKMKRFAGRFENFDRSEPAAFEHLTKIVKSGMR
jgi:hypothetical protein